MTISIVKPYNDALTKLVYAGHSTKSTKACYNQSIVFDLLPMNDYVENDYRLFMPYRRGSLTTSSKYGIAEAVWYRKATRSIDFILPFGKIWSSMTDEDGYVNSNYGYQLLRNQDLKSEIEKLYAVVDKKQPTKSIHLMIASTENQQSRTDLVCNNKIVVTLSRSINGNLLLSARVVARSIDVIFGLPYDMFAAQGLLTAIAHRLNRRSGYKDFVSLDELKFDVVNLHWYHDQNPSVDELRSLSNEALIVGYSRVLPFMMTDNEIDSRFQSIEDVKTYRNQIDRENTSVELIEGRDLSRESDLIDIYSDDSLNVIRALISEADAKSLNDKDSMMTCARIGEVITLISQNPYDRKSLIVDASSNLYYLVDTEEFDGFHHLYLDGSSE